MKVALTQISRSQPFCPEPQDYTFANTPSLCSRSVRRICGVPYRTRKMVANFSVHLPTEALPGVNQKGVSKLFTITKPVSFHIWKAEDSRACSTLAEFHGTLAFYTKAELGKQYNRGQRYVYLTWETKE